MNPLRLSHVIANHMQRDQTMKILIEAVSGDPNADIKDNTRRQRVIDANAILEALLLEYGVEAALEAVVRAC